MSSKKIQGEKNWGIGELGKPEPRRSEVRSQQKPDDTRQPSRLPLNGKFDRTRNFGLSFDESKGNDKVQNPNVK
jgi:hypothetical protein